MLDKTTCSNAKFVQLENDLSLLSKLKEEKGLAEIKDDRLKELGTEGIIAVVCPDGFQKHDVFGHLCKYNDQKQVHDPGLNGGGMLMCPTNPHYALEGRALINSVTGAWKLGKGKTIIVLSHWPCGQADEDNYPLARVLLDTLTADDHLTAILGVSSEVVLPLFHVDWTPFERNLEKKRRRTHVIKNAARKILAG